MTFETREIRDCGENPDQQKREYRLTIAESEMALANLDNFDFLLLRECEKSNLVSDKLLALEMIARRIEKRTRTQHDLGN